MRDEKGRMEAQVLLAVSRRRLDRADLAIRPAAVLRAQPAEMVAEKALVETVVAERLDAPLLVKEKPDLLASTEETRLAVQARVPRQPGAPVALEVLVLPAVTRLSV